MPSENSVLGNCDFKKAETDAEYQTDGFHVRFLKFPSCITFDMSGGQRVRSSLWNVLSMEGLGDIGANQNCYAVACGTGTGRSNSGLKNRLARAAKMMGVKPITAA